MSDVAQGPGWWMAEDGKFYPPHLHPNAIQNTPAVSSVMQGSVQGSESSQPLPTPPVGPGGQRKRLLLVGAGVVILVAVVVGLVVGLSGDSHNVKAQSGATQPDGTTAPASDTTGITTVKSEWHSSQTTADSATKAYDAAYKTLDTDLLNQRKRISQDASTVASDQYGLGCTVTSITAYESCQASEKQAAAAAQSDEATAQAQIQTDRQKYQVVSNTYANAVSADIGQVLNISWPKSMTTAVATFVETLRKYRGDLALAAAQTTTTSAAAGSVIQTQIGNDVGNISDAANIINDDLTHLQS